jgi:hypothetical protein
MNARLHRLTGVAEGNPEVPVQMCDAQYTGGVTPGSSLMHAIHGERDIAAHRRGMISLPTH